MTQTKATNTVRLHPEAEQIMQKIISFLLLFMCETLVKRILCLVLVAVDAPNECITKLIGVCDRSIRSYKKEVKMGNIYKLFTINSSGKKGKLEVNEADIIEEINRSNYHSKQQIVDMIFEKFGVKTSVSGVGRFLKKNGIKRLKCGSLPAKADTEKQRNFYDTVLHPLMEQAKIGKINLIFMDGSHYVMGCDFLGYIYGQTRRFIKTYSGRKRYNILGGIDFITKKVTTVTNNEYINALVVCDFLRKIASEYIGKTIYLVLDNASYQKCKLVQELAAELGINLVYIPPYSPNLNLIERLWKHVKGKLRTKFYDDFDIFSETIDSIISSTHNEDKEIIDRLINENVQIFDDLEAINENTFVSNKQMERKVA